MKLTLSSPWVLQVVIMITCGAHSDDKVGIVTTVVLWYYTHGPVNIRITTVIHCHLPRFLESECLSYNPVEYVSSVTGKFHNIRPVALNNGSIFCDVCELCVSMV